MTATLDVLKREIKALAFDQYGTIVDMQKGLVEAATPFLKAKGWDDAYLSGDEFAAFLTAENTRVREVLTSIGLVKS